MTVPNRSAKTKRPGLPSQQRVVKSIGWGWIIGGCLALILMFTLGIAVFTLLFNIVSGIFNGPQIDMWQGLAIWMLLWITSGLFRKVTA